MQWYVVHTKAREEHKACLQLKEQGYEVFLPLCKAVRKHARKTDIVLKPLFPRYLFVGFDVNTDPWRKINSTRGVSYIMQQGDKPIAVRGKVIEQFKQKSDHRGVVTSGLFDALKKGDKLEIVSGSFEGMDATFETMTDQERVNVLLTILGREVRLSLPIYELKAA